jgi:hypothetical protein
MSMTLSDWLDVTPADWMDRTLPGWQDWSYGDLLRTTPSAWWGTMYAPLSRQVAWSTTQPSRRHRHHDCDCGCHDHERSKRHHHEHGCRHCGTESCTCFCCVGDVDIAVYARLGEQRVVPITVENQRRRERTISLELSSWATRGGSPGPVETLLLEPREFALASCGEQDVTLVVGVRGADLAPENHTDDSEADDRRVPDVDSCQIVTADLRLVGCDHRPVRIAVVILPRDCDPYRISCDCACC